MQSIWICQYCEKVTVFLQNTEKLVTLIFFFSLISGFLKNKPLILKVLDLQNYYKDTTENPYIPHTQFNILHSMGPLS